MQFLLLVLINVLMACFFYLILRLKLEKYASDYREKRLKREMDEIINEFNETAERNITILDNRIDTIKSLLNKSGLVDSIDISIKDNSEEKSEKKAETAQPYPMLDDSGDESFIEKKVPTDAVLNLENKTTKENNSGFLSRLKANIKNSIQKNFETNDQSDYFNINNNGNNEKYSDINIKNEVRSGLSSDIKQTKDKIDIIIDYSHDNFESGIENNKYYTEDEEKHKNESDAIITGNHPVSEKEQISENKLENMFSESEDKYLLISKLYEKGYSVDLISRSSGIPIGEIKLVVDLNKSL